MSSYLRLSFAIGIAGVLLPVVLAVVEPVMTGRWEVRGSISAYYHSSVRDVFVGVLVTIGFFLVTYHVATRAYVSRTTTLAGVLAVGVALFPTMTEGSTPTVLQTWFPGGPETVRVIHFLCAIPFLILLAFISGWFGQDADRGEDPGSPDVPPLPPPAGQRAFPWADPGPWTRWGRFHRVCGAVILAHKGTGASGDHHPRGGAGPVAARASADRQLSRHHHLAGHGPVR
jgi:hypothetical protein